MDVQPVLLTDILCLEGFLDTRESPEGAWLTRYCRLADCQLSLYEDDEMTAFVMTVRIHGGTTVTGDDRSLNFQITEDSEFVLDCAASCLEEALRWREIIRTLTTPPPRVTMDDFTIISVIGRGFFGKVMLVENKETKERFAVKSVHKAKLVESGRPQTIVAERNVMMLIKNPFIIQLHFAFQTPTKFYLGLEYAPGGELFFHMQDIGLIPVEDACLYVAELAIALEHLHRLGVVYRDLKPENIVFDAEGHMKLTDFGLAKGLNETASTGTFCGSCFYLAPEIIARRPYSYGVDWWALGVLLCEMLTGVTPFASENKKELFDAIENEEPAIPSDIDENAESLIAWLLTKDPAERPGFEGLQSHPFFEHLDWEIVVDRRYQPSFVPEIGTGPEEATQYFAPEFTGEAAIDSAAQPAEDPFNVAGFSFFSPFVASLDGSREVFMDADLKKEYEDATRDVDD